MANWIVAVAVWCGSNAECRKEKLECVIANNLGFIGHAEKCFIDDEKQWPNFDKEKQR